MGVAPFVTVLCHTYWLKQAVGACPLLSFFILPKYLIIFNDLIISQEHLAT